jgi:molecular chaperone HtpG
MSEPATVQQPFQAEVARLLHLMVHSVYTEKEIFLRELVSNASDACDKLRYAAIAHPEVMGKDSAEDLSKLAIRITPDKTAKTLTIADSGIGMSNEELASNLGTIARSGTREFLDKFEGSAQSTSLIGQFGVGFYSAFMVADEIEVTSHKAGEAQAHVWRSDGMSGFTLREATEDEAAAVPRGTSIRLKLKADAESFLEPFEIERIVRTYSDHILFPVELPDGKGAWRQANAASALWQRSKSEVKTEQYDEAYRSLTGRMDKPCLTIHYKAEGRQSYAVLLFVPEQRPFDLFDPSRRGRTKLYVRRVFITDAAELLPAYLRFIAGVVDSEDVPLNISREMLQNNPLVAQIRKALTQRVLNELEGFAGKDGVAYETMWEAFGPVLKEGLYEDFERRDQLLRIARFKSTSGPGWRSLAQVVADMKPNQTDIYYLAGDSIERLQASPQLEAARARGVEVLLLVDPVDHFWSSAAPGFDGKPMKSLTQGDVDLSLIALLDTEKKDEQRPSSDSKGLIEGMKAALSERISDVRVSKRLVSSAVCLVAAGRGPDLGLEKILSRQERGAGVKPVLEVNEEHPLVRRVGDAFARGSDEAAELAELLLDQAHILDGEAPADPAKFAERMNRLLLKGLA